MNHDDFITEIQDIQAALAADIGTIKTLELTPEEQAVIDSLPPEKVNRIDELRARYLPADASVDIRRKTVEKGLALALLHAEKHLRDSWDMGQRLGVEQKNEFDANNA